jgi:soluble lytic murein transglycosylase
MRTQYEAAARYPTAYYGNELHAADILYQIGEGNLVLSFMTDLAGESSDDAVIAGLGKLTQQYNDAKAMLLVGKTALARGLSMEVYAFPDQGVPNYTPVGSQVDRCMVYAIARTESGFDQRDMSSAKAVGLMQVTPGVTLPSGSA